MSKAKKMLKLLGEVKQLPTLEIALANDPKGRSLLQAFTKPHQRLFFIPNKKYGVAVIDLTQFANYGQYLSTVSGKNSAAYFSRKAIKAGMSFEKFDPRNKGSEILSINNSSSTRQGKSMDESYLQAIEYPNDAANHYVAVMYNEIMVAYAWIIESQELLLLNRILGHSEYLDKGIMYYLLTSVVGYAFENCPTSKYLMYDTMIGASDGLKMYKKRCGFASYIVKWKI